MVELRLQSGCAWALFVAVVSFVSCLFLHGVIRNYFSFLLQGQRRSNLGKVLA